MTCMSTQISKSNNQMGMEEQMLMAIDDQYALSSQARNNWNEERFMAIRGVLLNTLGALNQYYYRSAFKHDKSMGLQTEPTSVYIRPTYKLFADLWLSRGRSRGDVQHHHEHSLTTA